MLSIMCVSLISITAGFFIGFSIAAKVGFKSITNYFEKQGMDKFEALEMPEKFIDLLEKSK